MERVVHQGEFYRHFKNKLYQIITVASHSETGEQMVVYQALYGDYRTYVRPLEMFLSEVDHVKYPDVKQRYRFERVVFPEACQGADYDPASGGPGYRTVNRDMDTESDENSEQIPESFPEQALEQIPEHSRVVRTELPTEPPTPHPALLRFLDADTYEERMACLKGLEKTAGQAELDSLYVVLDMKPQTGTVPEQLEGIRRNLKVQEHYDGGHLR